MSVMKEMFYPVLSSVVNDYPPYLYAGVLLSLSYAQVMSSCLTEKNFAKIKDKPNVNKINR